MRTFLSVSAGALVALVVILLPTRSPRVVIRRLERNWAVTIGAARGGAVRLGVLDLAAPASAMTPSTDGSGKGSPAAAMTPSPDGFGAAAPASGMTPSPGPAALISTILRQDLLFEGAFELLPVAASTDVVSPASAPGVVGPASVPGVVGPASVPGVVGPASVPGVVGPASVPAIPGAVGPASAPGAVGPASVPAVRSGLTIPDLSPWRNLGADGLVTGELRMSGSSVEIDIRIYKVSTGEEAFARGYLAGAGQERAVAHTISDEIHQALAGVKGIARSRLAFVSDRGGMRRELGGMMRRFKEIWIADYDGDNERRITSDGDLDMTPSWSPDGRAIAYTSLRPGFQDIFVTLLDEHRVLNPTRGTGTNRLPAWSPDGSRIAFASTRSGNEEIYVMNRDGSAERRLTYHPAIDTAPAWSPDGARIAFTSNRTGSPQIWVMNADGSNPRALTSEKYCDRPTWSPLPFNEVAYVARTTTGYDIKVVDVTSGVQRQLTFGHGFNESPSFSPNGRHIAFTSTRHGGRQIWVISRTGDGARQVTAIGENTMPAWR